MGLTTLLEVSVQNVTLVDGPSIDGAGILGDWR